MTQRVNDAWSDLAAWTRSSAGLTLRAEQLAQLRAYVALLQRWNAKIALVSQRAAADIVTRHVADSLFAAAYTGAAGHIADLGSGAGFPAVPIAVMHPTVDVCCFEATGKKVSFLQATRAELGLGNLRVREGRIESAIVDPAYRSAFDLVTSRALAEVDRLLDYARPLLRSGGRLMAMRAVGAIGSVDGERVEYRLPDGTARELRFVDAA